jgi:anti-sigma regulatory factor (Ser/Thr protein kinase)
VAKLASLVASELVTNAVVHARTPSVMALRLANDTLHVSVRDNDPRPMFRPVPGLSGAHDGDHGRGLLILDAMADEWGTHPTADGKVVWATISVNATGTQTG